MLFDRDFVFYDGAMGTMLQANGLKIGERPDIMNITDPDNVERVHRMYVEAGSDIICTNTFGASAAALAGTGHGPGDIITAAVRAAKRACAEGTLVALDIGPVGHLLEPLGDLAPDRAYELFREQAVFGEKTGADLVAIETMSDLGEISAAILAVRENTALPVFATMTFGKTGCTFTGVTPESFAEMAQRLGAVAVGLNCSLAPSEMYETAERLARSTDLPLIIKPNAGLPDSKTGLYDLTPAEFARQMVPFAKIGAKYNARTAGQSPPCAAVSLPAKPEPRNTAMIIGGCCGTTPEYIKALREAFAEL